MKVTSVSVEERVAAGVFTEGLQAFSARLRGSVERGTIVRGGWTLRFSSGSRSPSRCELRRGCILFYSGSIHFSFNEFEISNQD